MFTGFENEFTLQSWSAMDDSCRRITSVAPEIHLPDHRLTLLHLRPYLMTRGWSIRPHEHSFYEASFILQGTAVDASTGQQLSRGDVFFHGPQVVHAWSAPAEPCVRLIFGFAVDPPVPVPVAEHWPHWPELLYDIAQILALGEQASAGWRDQVSARLAVILARVLTLGDLPTETGDIHGERVSFVSTVEAFLLDNLKHPIQLEDVAACLGCSVSSLTHRYRAHTGVSVGQRLLALRMERAAHLLTSTDLSLEAICDAIGITDPPYLCRLFKRYVHATPGEYRAQFMQTIDTAGIRADAT